MLSLPAFWSRRSGVHAGEQALQAMPAIVPFQAESPIMAQNCATESDSLDFGTELPGAAEVGPLLEHDNQNADLALD